MGDILKVKSNGSWVGIPAIKGDPGGLNGAASSALITLLSHVAYDDQNGAVYLSNLEAALANTEVTALSASFTQGAHVIYDTDPLSTLAQYLVVTATYSDSSTSEIAYGNYTLSGTLEVGTSTITASYSGQTATFSVTVTLGIVKDGLIHYWDAIDNTAEGHDSTSDKWYDLVGSNTLTAVNASNISWDADALALSGIANQHLLAASNSTNASGKTIEVVFSTTTSQAATIVTPFHDNTSNSTINEAYGKINLFSDDTFSVKGKSETTYTLPSGVNALSALHSISASFSDKSTVSAVYANAIAASKGATTHSLQRSAAKMSVGASPDDYLYQFAGKIHAIRIYSKLLTATEVAKNYDADCIKYGLT